MPTLTFKVSPHEAAAIRHAASASRVSFSTYARRALLGVGKGKSARARKSIMKPGCVVISSEHPISDQTLYDAIHEY